MSAWSSLSGLPLVGNVHPFMPPIFLQLLGIRTLTDRGSGSTEIIKPCGSRPPVWLHSLVLLWRYSTPRLLSFARVDSVSPYLLYPFRYNAPPLALLVQHDALEECPTCIPTPNLSDSRSRYVVQHPHPQMLYEILRHRSLKHLPFWY